MGSRRKLNRFRRDRDPWSDGAGVAAVRYAAVADIDDTHQLETAKRAVHDGVIQMAGSSRMSGVRFIVVPADDMDRVRELVNEGERHPDFAEGANAGLITFLEEHPKGALVAAAVVVAQTPNKARLS